MKLYWFQVAPNPTKVRLYIAEKKAGGAAIELEEVVVALPRGEQNAPEHKARNPFGSLPVLELDDGSTIVESLAIIDYLEALYPQPPMWGTTPREQARAREVERIVEQRLLNPLATYIHATNSPLGLPPNEHIALWVAPRWPLALNYVNTLLADGREFLCGAAPSVADCTLAATLQFARFAKLPVLTGMDAVASWDARYRTRPPARSALTL